MQWTNEHLYTTQSRMNATLQLRLVVCFVVLSSLLFPSFFSLLSFLSFLFFSFFFPLFSAPRVRSCRFDPFPLRPVRLPPRLRSRHRRVRVSSAHQIDATRDYVPQLPTHAVFGLRPWFRAHTAAEGVRFSATATTATVGGGTGGHTSTSAFEVSARPIHTRAR